MKSSDVVDRLLAAYRLWGIVATGAFILFALLLSLYSLSGGAHFGMLFAAFVLGFLWIGATSLSRHSLVNLKKCMGVELGIAEFFLTQFVIVLFPHMYGKVKREVALYKAGVSDKAEP